MNSCNRQPKMVFSPPFLNEERQDGMVIFRSDTRNEKQVLNLSQLFMEPQNNSQKQAFPERLPLNFYLVLIPSFVSLQETQFPICSPLLLHTHSTLRLPSSKHKLLILWSMRLISFFAIVLMSTLNKGCSSSQKNSLLIWVKIMLLTEG